MSAHSVSPTSKTSPQFYHISAFLPSPLPCPNWQHLSPGGHQQPPCLSLGFPLAPRQQGALVLSDDLILRSKPSNGFPAGLAHPPFAYLALQEPARVTLSGHTDLPVSSDTPWHWSFPLLDYFSQTPQACTLYGLTSSGSLTSVISSERPCSLFTYSALLFFIVLNTLFSILLNY